MDIYQSPEILELGDAASLTLGENVIGDSDGPCNECCRAGGGGFDILV